MKTSIYTKVSLNVVAIFGIIILMSFVPDHFREFFGDWQCKGSVYMKGTDQFYDHWEGCDRGPSSHLATIHWGYRHWLWFFMGIALFIVQIIRIINTVNKHLDKK